MQNARGTKMSRYIDAENVKSYIFGQFVDRFPQFTLNAIIEGVDDIESEDVVPVVHAYNKSKDSFLCSACTFGDFGLFNHGGKYTPKYCPNCGAKMDGGRNDG